MCETVCARWSFFSGGLTLNHYPQYAHGADGYLCAFMSFKPELGLRHWKALNEGDGATVRQVMDIERRLWGHIETYDGGFNAVFRGIMELFGVAPRYIRKPFHTMTDEQMERLKTYLSENGLGP